MIITTVNPKWIATSVAATTLNPNICTTCEMPYFAFFYPSSEVLILLVYHF